jgi:tRNA(Arg) A34 adenosine deaminase TadA
VRAGLPRRPSLERDGPGRGRSSGAQLPGALSRSKKQSALQREAGASLADLALAAFAARINTQRPPGDGLAASAGKARLTGRGGAPESARPRPISWERAAAGAKNPSAVLSSMTQPVPDSEQRPMRRAIALAEQAAAMGEVPVGAVLVDGRDGRIVAAAHNRVEADRDPCAHAELLAIRAGCRALGRKWLEGCDLYVTLEPCAMCAAALGFARVRRVYFGAYDPKGGGVEHGARVFEQPQCNWRPEVIGGLDERACAARLEGFFRARR